MDASKRKEGPTDLSFGGLFAPNSNYLYFADSQQHPFCYGSNSHQQVNSWWMAEASMLVYVRDHDFVSTSLAQAGLPHTRFFENNATQGFVTHNDFFAIVCFRGTEVSEIQDILTDLNLPLTENGGRGEVHTGFKQALEQIWNRNDCADHNMLKHLNHITAVNPELKIWFTGHSLGAALATLAAERFPKAQGLYTFGSPRVGDRDFRNSFEVSTYRYVNNNDIVTMVPPAIGYQHIGQLKYIDDHGTVYDNPGKWVQMKRRITGHLGHIGDLLDHWSQGNLDAIPSDYLNDHAPIYYVVHTWNDYIEDKQSIPHLNVLLQHRQYEETSP